jgi:hypothetical protein
VQREIEALLDEVYDNLPERMPHVEDYEEIAPGVTGYAWSGEHGTLSYGVGEGGKLVFSYDLPDYGAHASEAEVGDTLALNRFLAAAETYAERSFDPWTCEGEHGYADYRVVGTDVWEDQAGMEAIKVSQNIPEAWFLVKVVRFGIQGRSLAEIDAWLKEFCAHPYRRVGWSSSCTTKVGIAFESQHDAFYFHLRWR